MNRLPSRWACEMSRVKLVRSTRKLRMACDREDVALAAVASCVRRSLPWCSRSMTLWDGESAKKNEEGGEEEASDPVSAHLATSHQISVPPLFSLSQILSLSLIRFHPFSPCFSFKSLPCLDVPLLYYLLSPCPCPCHVFFAPSTRRMQHTCSALSIGRTVAPTTTACPLPSSRKSSSSESSTSRS